ncbi:hypothetical protein ACFWUQ_23955 [Streptomyces sp. NPDC058662]|uniref:hypothetical protein n=1 Tax=Streptomyces sp. NPDC058662 TaxID=3346583 RepID=UPI00365D563E
MFGDLPGGVRAQRYGSADGAQSAVLVVAAEDEELRAGQGAGRRRTARRTSRSRRPRRRKDSGLEQLALIGLLAVVALSLVMGVLRWLAAHPWIVVLTLLAAAAAGAAWWWRRSEAARWEQVKAQGLRYAVDQLDRLHHRQLMRRRS